MWRRRHHRGWWTDCFIAAATLWIRGRVQDGPSRACGGRHTPQKVWEYPHALPVQCSPACSRMPLSPAVPSVRPFLFTHVSMIVMFACPSSALSLPPSLPRQRLEGGWTATWHERCRRASCWRWLGQASAYATPTMNLLYSAVVLQAGSAQQMGRAGHVPLAATALPFPVARPVNAWGRATLAGTASPVHCPPTAQVRAVRASFVWRGPPPPSLLQGSAPPGSTAWLVQAPAPTVPLAGSGSRRG